MNLYVPLIFVSIIIIKNCYCQKSREEIIAKVTAQIFQNTHADCIQIFRGARLTYENTRKIYKILKRLAVPETRTTTGIYSFKNYVRRKKKIEWKMSCYQPLKVSFFGDEESKLGFSHLSREIPLRGSIWLFFIDTDIVEFFKMAYVPFDIQLIVSVIESEDSVKLYEVYRVNETFPTRVVDYGNWTEQNGLKAAEGLVYLRRSDLEGVVVKLGSIENWPTSYRDWNGSWDGFFPRLWALIQERINCSSIHFGSVDGTTGAYDGNGSWSGLVGMALRGEIDIIVSELTMTKERSKVLDYFHPTLKTRYQIYFHWLGNNLNWESIFRPFGKSIWIAIVVWLLIGTIAMSICYYFSLLYGFEDDAQNIFSPTRSFFFMLQSFCQQGHYAIPRSTACKILFFASYMVSSVLIPSYSASLVSVLTQQNPYRPFDSLQTMVTDGSYRLLVKENTAEHAFFSQSEDELLQNVYKKLIAPIPPKYAMESTKQALHTVCTVPRYALFGIESIYNIRMATYMRPECPIISLSKPLSTIYLTWGVAKGHPYSGLINHHLKKLIDIGIVKRIERSVWPINAKLEEPTAKTEVNTQEVFQVFVLTGIFIIVSGTILLFEKYYHRCKKKKKIQRVKRVNVLPKKYDWYYRMDIYS